MVNGLFVPALVFLALPASVQVPAVSTPDAKAEDAVRCTRAMLGEILDAQKKIIMKFKALPESDDIRILFGKNMYTWDVSDKSFSARREEFDAALAAYQKDFKAGPLIDELRLYAKKLMRTSQETTSRYEARITKAQKELRDGKTLDKDGKSVDISEPEKKTQEALLKILPFEIEFLKEYQNIAAAYGSKISKMMD